MSQSPIFPNKRERNDTWIAFAVLLLFGLGIYGLGFADRDDDDARAAAILVPQPEGETRAERPPVVIGRRAVRKQEAVPDKLPVQPVLVSTAAEASEVYVPVAVIPTEALVVQQPVQPTPPVVLPTDPEITAARSGRPVTGGQRNPRTETLALAREDIATVAEPTPTPEAQRIAKSVRPTLPTGSCTVIAGSFKSAANRNTMRRELIKDGYQVVVGQLNNGLFYTGIPVGCMDGVTRERVETELKSQYSVDAWVLRQ